MNVNPLMLRMVLEMKIDPPAEVTEKVSLRHFLDQNIYPICEIFRLQCIPGGYDYYSNEADEQQKIYTSVIQYNIEGIARDARTYHCLAGILESVFEYVLYDERFRECSSSHRLVDSFD